MRADRFLELNIYLNSPVIYHQTHPRTQIDRFFIPPLCNIVRQYFPHAFINLAIINLALANQSKDRNLTSNPNYVSLLANVRCRLNKIVLKL